MADKRESLIKDNIFKLMLQLSVPGIIGMEMANRNDSCQCHSAGIKKAPCGTSLA